MHHRHHHNHHIRDMCDQYLFDQLFVVLFEIGVSLLLLPTTASSRLPRYGFLSLSGLGSVCFVCSVPCCSALNSFSLALRSRFSFLDTSLIQPPSSFVCVLSLSLGLASATLIFLSNWVTCCFLFCSASSFLAASFFLASVSLFFLAC